VFITVTTAVATAVALVSARVPGLLTRKTTKGPYLTFTVAALVKCSLLVVTGHVYVAKTAGITDDKSNAAATNCLFRQKTSWNRRSKTICKLHSNSFWYCISLQAFEKPKVLALNFSSFEKKTKEFSKI
jgi:hypothetical protein